MNFVELGVGILGIGVGVMGIKNITSAQSSSMDVKHGKIAIVISVLLFIILWLMVSCGNDGFENKGSMRWPNPFRRKRDFSCPRNFSMDGKKCVKDVYTPDHSASAVCPPGYSLNMDGKCAKFWADGSSKHIDPSTCAQSKKYMVDWDEENTCREPCKDLFEFNQKRGKCTAKCPPGLKDFGSYCKSQTPVRAITRSDGKY